VHIGFSNPDPSSFTEASLLSLNPGPTSPHPLNAVTNAYENIEEQPLPGAHPSGNGPWYARYAFAMAEDSDDFNESDLELYLQIFRQRTPADQAAFV